MREPCRNAAKHGGRNRTVTELDLARGSAAA